MRSNMALSKYYQQYPEVKSPTINKRDKLNKNHKSSLERSQPKRSENPDEAYERYFENRSCIRVFLILSLPIQRFARIERHKLNAFK